MERRKVLQSLAAGSVSTTVLGSGTAVASNDNPGINFTEQEEVTGDEINKLRSDIQSDEEARKLIQKVRSLGWKPKWDSLRAIRRSVETESQSGSFDTAAIQFEQFRQNKQGSVFEEYQKEEDHGPNDIDESIILQWIGNKNVDLGELIDRGSPNSVVLHLKDDVEMKDELNPYIGPLTNELSIYEVKNGEIVTETVVPDHDANKDYDEEGMFSTQSQTYCETDVKVIEDGDGTPCWSLTCLALSGLAIGGGVASCIGSGGVLCAAGAVGASAAYIDCLACDTLFVTTVDVDREWLADRLNYSDDLNCSELLDSRDGEILVNACEVDDIETREEFSTHHC